MSMSSWKMSRALVVAAVVLGIAGGSYGVASAAISSFVENE